MKSNISKKEIESGQEIIDLLSKVNPRLLPHILKDIVSEYQRFLPNSHKYGLWSSSRTKQKKFKQKYNKIMLLFSGVTAGGKDAIRQEMERISPNLFSRTVTTTSRNPRPGEVNGQDYNFLENSKVFRQSIKNGEFIEYIKRGTSFYGLPKKSIDEAILHSSPIIYSQVEMSAWTKIEKYMATFTETKILTLKIFVLPDMDFSKYKDWLIKKRSNSDINSRLVKTGWEIKKAPKKADFIITNRIKENSNTLTYTAQTIINQVLELLSSSDFDTFPQPFNTDKELSDIESILKFHDSIE